MSKTNAEVADTIERAVDLIRANGLHRGDYWPDAIHDSPYQQGLPMCTLGALVIASGCSVAQDSLDREIRKEVSLIGAVEAVGHDIPHWSDNSDQETVVDTLLGIAKDLRNS